jgi:hypothetical protein
VHETPLAHPPATHHTAPTVSETSQTFAINKGSIFLAQQIDPQASIILAGD